MDEGIHGENTYKSYVIVMMHRLAFARIFRYLVDIDIYDLGEYFRSESCFLETLSASNFEYISIAVTVSSELEELSE